MAWTYGAAWVISICKRGSDIMKMRREQKKENSVWFWGVTACVPKVKTETQFCLDRHLTYSVFKLKSASSEKHIFASYFFSATM